MSSLYIHIPFCEKKCFYCSFVVSIGQEHRIDDYLDALAREAEPHRGRTLRTLYFGGGTPSLLSPAQLAKLFGIIRGRFSLSGDCEITLEANPEGLDRDKLDLLRAEGVNRVSLGVQSLNDRYLRYLGRCHDRDTALKAFTLLREAGFDNINADLMFSFPGQSDAKIKADVAELTALGSEHLSLYSLSVEKNSRFHARQLELDNDETRGRQYVLITDLLEAAGFRQYEVSNFAKPGRESRHNLNYWRGGEYLGLGVGAHSHLNGRRFWNVDRLPVYLSRIREDGNAVEAGETLETAERMLETLLIGLRMNDGVDLDELQNRFGIALRERTRSTIRACVDNRLLSLDENRLRATGRGRLVLDDICGRLI